MIVNGYIEEKSTTGGGTDLNGRPVKVTDVWGTPIEAHIILNSQNNRGTYQDGKFTVATYIIIIETVEGFAPKRVRLTNFHGGGIGGFEVQSIEYLDAVQQIKIIV